MKVVGIVGRLNQNMDGSNEIEVLNSYNRAFSRYDDVITIGIMPPKNVNYYETSMEEEFSLNNEELKKLDKVLDLCDGFLIQGGCEWCSHDEYVINYAIKNDKPLLGICLGMQALCVMLSRNTEFDNLVRIENLENGNYLNHRQIGVDYVHNVLLTENGLLHSIIGKDSIMVNSRHSFCVSDFGCLNIEAVSSDGIIEAVSFPSKKFILGIQWHPESLIDKDENSQKIFDEFINRM